MALVRPSILESQPTILCGGCGYDLRGLTSDRCPECGLIIDASRGKFIVWERRGYLGWMSALRSTVLMSTFRPWQLGRACEAPVDSRSAKVFRWYMVIQAWIFVSGALLAGMWQPGNRSTIQGSFQYNTDLGGFWQTGAVLFPVLPIGLFITLHLATSIAPMFHLRRFPPLQRNRAMAISYYTCAPLAFVPLACIAFAVAALFRIEDWVTNGAETILSAAAWIGEISAGLILLALWLVPWIAMHSLRYGHRRPLLVAIGQLVQWAIAVSIGLIGFPIAVGLVYVIWA